MVFEEAMAERNRQREQRRRIAAWRRQESAKASRRRQASRRRRGPRRGCFAASVASSPGVAATPSSSEDAAAPSGEMDAASKRACSAAIGRLVAALPYLPDESPPPVRNDFWGQLLFGGSTGEAVSQESNQQVVADSINEVVPDFTEDAVPEFTEDAMPDFTEEAVPNFTEEVVPDSSQKCVPDSKVKVVLPCLDEYASSVSEDILAMHETVCFHHAGQSWQQIQMFLFNSGARNEDKASSDSLSGSKEAGPCPTPTWWPTAAGSSPMSWAPGRGRGSPSSGVAGKLRSTAMGMKLNAL